MADEDVNVSVADDHLDQFGEVVRRMEKAGLKVQQQLEAAGVVSGSIEATRIDRLQKVPGVAAVERSREVRIPPPESEIQ